MEAHLADCPPCIELVASLRKTVALCHEYQPHEKLGPISEAVRTRLQEAWQARGHPTPGTRIRQCGCRDSRMTRIAFGPPSTRGVQVSRSLKVQPYLQNGDTPIPRLR